MMAPTFHQAAIDLEPHARLVKVDTEAEPQLAARFNIRSIPTLAIFFKGGREIARQSGALDLGTLKRWLQPHLRSLNFPPGRR
jgi:thioredoxin 2